VIGSGGPIRLNGDFWTYSKIMSGLGLRSDWGISEDLIPFFGDWHDVICLSLSTDNVVHLDDDRRTIATWPDTQSFLASLLVSVPVELAGPSATLVSSHLSPELKARTDEILRKEKT
jgi:hypothetical protein